MTDTTDAAALAAELESYAGGKEYIPSWLLTSSVSLLRTQAARIAELEAALEARQVPEGWQLVPVEPTEEMISAFFGPGGRLIPAYVGALKRANDAFARDYADMLHAAPTAPAPTQEKP